MTDESAEDLVDRLRRALVNVLRWAELCDPRMIAERHAYDTDLDEAEDVIDVAAAWMALHSARPSSITPGRVVRFARKDEET